MITDFERQQMNQEWNDHRCWHEFLEREPEKANAQIFLVLSYLPDRQADVVTFRLGINCPVHTLREISEYLGVSSERVRQIEAKTLKQVYRLINSNDEERAQLYEKAKINHAQSIQAYNKWREFLL